MSRAVVLLSGGLDSYTAAAVAQRIARRLSPGAIVMLHDHPRALATTRLVLDAIGTEPGTVP